MAQITGYRVNSARPVLVGRCECLQVSLQRGHVGLLMY